MTSIPTCGQVGFGDHRIDIVDCRLWQLRGRTPVCNAGHDLAGCASCAHRVSREGNLIDPPVLGGTMPQVASEPTPAPAPASRRMRGLGDAVERVTKAVGIKPCGGCQKRRDALNRAFPFKNGNPPPDGQPPAAADGGERK